MVYIVSFLFALLISGYYYAKSQPELALNRRLYLFGLRTISVFILLLLIFSPILYLVLKKKEIPQVLVLKDISNSMRLDDKDKDIYSLNAAIKTKYEDKGYEVIEYGFASGISGSDDNTLLGKSLQEIGKERDFSKVKSIVLASDGWFRDEDISFINRLGIPIFTLADTSRTVTPDLSITNIAANRFAYRNESTPIQATIKSNNYSGPASVKLFIGKNLVQSKQISLKANEELAVEFQHRFANMGFYPMQVEVSALPRELRLGNNTLPSAIEVLSDKDKILVFSDSPAWDNKFILDAISTNNRWESISYQVREGKLFKADRPTSLNEVSTPAVIILINNGRFTPDPNTVSYIKKAVKQGTGIFYQGYPIPEFADILPLNKSNITTMYQGFLNLKPNGWQWMNPLGIDVNKLPPLDYYYTVAKPNAEILATMNNPQNSPAIALSDSGFQRSIALSFLNLWKWQMQIPEDNYTKFITNAITWLNNKTTGNYSAIYKSSYLSGEEISLKLRAQDDVLATSLDKNPQVTIYDEKNNKILSDYMLRENDDYTLNFNPEKPGNYHFEIKENDSKHTTKGKFTINDQSIETRDFGYNLPLLHFLSSETQGKMISDADQFSPIPATPKTNITKLDIPIYKKWYVIGLFLLVFCVELYLRRRWGLL